MEDGNCSADTMYTMAELPAALNLDRRIASACIELSLDVTVEVAIDTAPRQKKPLR